MLRSGQVLPVVSAAALTAPVDVATWGGTPNARAVFHPPAETTISRPRFLNAIADDVRLLGPFFLWPDVGRVPPDFPSRTLCPELSIARLSNVICLPGQIALHMAASGPVLLEEALTNHWDHHAVHLDKIDNDLFALREDAALEVLPGRYLYLDNMHSPHFGHFLTDVLSKVWAWEAARAAGITDLRVLVEAHEPPHVVALLEACGIPRATIHAVKRPVRCAEVLFASQSFMIQGWTSPVALATWARIRDALDEGEGPARVFISRARVPNRKMVNEPEVEAIFRRRGFFIAHPQELTMRQQVTMWANARVVAGTAGSNMFGLGFQRRLERALLINSPNFLQLQEMFLQAGCDSETSYYFGEALDGRVHGLWRVVSQDLAAQVDRWLAEPSPATGPVIAAALRKTEFLALFDEAFYLATYLDIRAAVAAGTASGARQHYEAAGFDEGRAGFRFDPVWYAAQYPDVLGEVAAGRFVDCLHHYVAIGHLVNFAPHGTINLMAEIDDPGIDDALIRLGHVDLGMARIIGKVQAYWNATTSAVSAGVILAIAIEPDEWTMVLPRGAPPTAGDEALIWQPDLPAFARYVRVHNADGAALTAVRIDVSGPDGMKFEVRAPDQTPESRLAATMPTAFVRPGDNAKIDLVRRPAEIEPLDLSRLAATGADEAALVLAKKVGSAAVGEHDPFGAAINLARGRPALQSSVSQWSRGATLAGDAAGAVDGRPNGSRKFHTAMEDGPWWQVDLGHAQTIAAVRIYNTVVRAVRRRFERFTISIAFQEGDEWIEVFSKDDEREIGGINGNPFLWRPELSVFGRLVRVTAIGRGFLHLDQVEVYGSGEIPPPVVGPDGALFARFISLGDNCEFGIVQHETGVDLSDLLRYAGATDNAALIAAIRDRFAQVGGSEDVEMTETAVQEWHTLSRSSKIAFHTFRFSHEVDRETISTREAWRLRYLSGKLIEDLERADKIFVRRSDQPVASATMVALFEALRAIGEVTLLWVSLADGAHPHGTVEVVAPGFLHGYIRFLTPPHYAQEVRVHDWRDVCLAALQAVGVTPDMTLPLP